MNWLEVGCPHCPSKSTFPQSAAGRTVTCPECERSYLVPTPTVRAPGSDAWSTEPNPRPADRPRTVEKPESRTAGGNEATIAYVPDLPHSNDPTIADIPVSESPPKREPVQSDFRPPGPKRQLLPLKTVAATDDPKLAIDSPLAELPILEPPRGPSGSSPSAKAAEVARSNPKPPDMPTHPAAPSRSNPSAGAFPPPHGSQIDEARDLTAEAQLRMRRAELRTRVNLAIFLGGTLVMVVFAWVVIRFSRPR